MLDYRRIDGDERVAVQFEAVETLLREAKAELRAGSLVGSTEKVVAAEHVLRRALIDLEVVTSVPWAAIAQQPDFAKRPAEECDSGRAELAVADAVERELPGFWAFFKSRHPQWAGIGPADGPPIGAVPAYLVYDAMAETIPAYVAALRGV